MAVVPKYMYNERAKQAVLKNVKFLSRIDLKKAKARAVSLCEGLGSGES